MPRQVTPGGPIVRFLKALLLLVPLSIGPALAQTPVHSVPPGMACKGDVIVWVNTRSGIYHYQGERYFGSTKNGKFICEKAARAEGDRPTKNGQ
jgi:hypothetical protein